MFEFGGSSGFMGSSQGFPTAHRSYEHPSHAPFGHSLPLGGGEGRGEGGVMESSVFLSDLLTAHEPELHRSLQCRQATFRFMGRKTRAVGSPRRSVGLRFSIFRSLSGDAPELLDRLIKGSPRLGALGLDDRPLARSPELFDGFDA